MADDLTITLDGGDWLGIALATAAAFFVGFLWFTVLFGNRWAKEFGMDTGEAPGMKAMLPSMLKDLVGNFAIAFVLFHTIVVWMPELWADHLGTTAENSAAWLYGAYGAGFAWIGFFVPVSLSRTGWEKRSWGWFGIDVSYHLVKLAVMGQILVAFA